jgi:hypothetical protein
MPQPVGRDALGVQPVEGVERDAARLKQADNQLLRHPGLLTL